MNKNKLEWKKDELWKGCMLVSIAHAIMVAHYPELANENSWDGINYSVQDSAGTRGTITFHPEFCVGAFRNDHSDRIELVGNKEHAKEYFIGAPKSVIEIAEEETLQYLLDDVNNEVYPVITTAFWGNDEGFFTIDSLDDMYDNGGFILEIQTMDIESSIEALIEDYEMTENQVKLLKKIFNKKINENHSQIILSKEDIKLIELDSPEGLAESKESFSEINIILE